MREGLLTSDDMFEIALYGGPAELARRTRASVKEILEKKIKVPYRGGYEHFEFASDPADSAPVTFTWTMRTKIAE
jgi:hypothetical protein